MKNILKIVFTAILFTTFSHHQAFASPNHGVLAKHLIDKQDDDFKKFIKYNKETDTLTLESYETKGKIAALGLTGLGCGILTIVLGILVQKSIRDYKNLPVDQKCNCGKEVGNMCGRFAFDITINLIVNLFVNAITGSSNYTPATAILTNETSNKNTGEKLVDAIMGEGILMPFTGAAAYFSCLYAYKAYVKRTSHTPKLMLSPTGIYLNGVKFANWEDVKDIASNKYCVTCNYCATYMDQSFNLSNNFSDLPMENSD